MTDIRHMSRKAILTPESLALVQSARCIPDGCKAMRCEGIVSSIYPVSEMLSATAKADGTQRMKKEVRKNFQLSIALHASPIDDHCHNTFICANKSSILFA
jgi:hypothetical protein